jgi:hypothetical protein
MSEIALAEPDYTAKLENIFAFKSHDIANKYIFSKAYTRAIIKGTQGGGTTTAMYDAALRILGIHPVPERNKLEKPIRCVSKVLPGDHDDEQNQQFVEFRKFIPPELWTKRGKLTARNKVGKLNRLVGGTAEIEFMASTQDIDAFMSVQRSAYYQDEEISRMKWDENVMRLNQPRSNGELADTTLTMTPVVGLDWTYDSIWKRAKKIYRSQTICKEFGYPELEEQNIQNSDIEIFCWATDDNPALEKDSIDSIFNEIDDKDELALRRYGVFRQVSGRIYKSYDSKIHFIPFDKVFDAGEFRHYWHFRMIDFHPAKPWYVTWVAVTPTHEWFVWNELVANHDRRTNFEVRDEIKSESLIDEDDEFNRRTLVDPLAKVKQGNTGMTTFDDISLTETGLRRCESADTKNSRGRVHIKTRLKNSLVCGVPGNNINRFAPPDERYQQYMPTIWFLDSCPVHNEHMRSWRYIDYKQEHVKASRTVKRESEKWSDFPRNLEFLGAFNPVWYRSSDDDNWHRSELFQGRRRSA